MRSRGACFASSLVVIMSAYFDMRPSDRSNPLARVVERRFTQYVILGCSSPASRPPGAALDAEGLCSKLEMTVAAGCWGANATTPSACDLDGRCAERSRLPTAATLPAR